MTTTTTKTGLAQYMRMHGAKLIDVTKNQKNKKTYVFESDQTEQEWRISYAKSNFSQFNAGVMELINIKI